MKRCIAAFSFVVGWSAICLAQTPAELDLLEKLNGPDHVEALETVLKTPDEYSAPILFFGAAAALAEKRLEDSGFLFYAGQLRMRFDQKCFPPKEAGSEDPFLGVVLVSQLMGGSINPAVMAEPKVYAKAIDRVKKWSPKAPEKYNPGYEFKERLSEKDAHEAAKPNRTEFLSRMGDLAKLLNDAEYFAAFRIIQESNLAEDDNDKVPATKEEREKATDTMKRIEKDKGLKGIFTE